LFVGCVLGGNFAGTASTVTSAGVKTSNAFSNGYNEAKKLRKRVLASPNRTAIMPSLVFIR
jgi:hypothetical protein